jgi:hypothetical protein
MGVKGNTLQEQMVAQTTDQAELPSKKQVMCVQFNLHVAAKPGQALKIVKAMCAFIDGVGKAKLTPAAKLAADKEWTTYEESLTKEDPRARVRRGGACICLLAATLWIVQG